MPEIIQGVSSTVAAERENLTETAGHAQPAELNSTRVAHAAEYPTHRGAAIPDADHNTVRVTANTLMLAQNEPATMFFDFRNDGNVLQEGFHMPIDPVLDPNSVSWLTGWSEEDFATFNLAMEGTLSSPSSTATLPPTSPMSTILGPTMNSMTTFDLDSRQLVPQVHLGNVQVPSPDFTSSFAYQVPHLVYTTNSMELPQFSESQAAINAFTFSSQPQLQAYAESTHPPLHMQDTSPPLGPVASPSNTDLVKAVDVSMTFNGQAYRDSDNLNTHLPLQMGETRVLLAPVMLPNTAPLQNETDALSNVDLAKSDSPSVPKPQKKRRADPNIGVNDENGDTNMREPRVRKAPALKEVVALTETNQGTCPPWATYTKDFLDDMRLGPEWMACIESWLLFEKTFGALDVVCSHAYWLAPR